MRFESSRSVLVVDDEPNIRELIADTLRESGYVVETAADGFEALRAVARSTPGVIMLDLMMPELDAGGLVDRLRENPRYAAIPILVVTAAYAAHAAAQRLGASACLPKPFELDDLVALVGELVGQPLGL